MAYSVERSRIMRAVKSWDTGPEMRLRKVLHSMGFRYRLHCADLPGKPDIAFPSRRKVVFVNSRFWHGHGCARGARKPRTNREYWRDKITRNMKRDRCHNRKLKVLGWDAMTVWECELKKQEEISDKVVHFSNATRKSAGEAAP